MLATSYWNDSSGRNLLKGVPDDTDNPPLLDDSTILYILSTSRVARAAFNIILPTLLVEEQDRLNNLVSDNQRLAALIADDNTIGGATQHAWNGGIPVRTVGPHGGK